MLHPLCTKSELVYKLLQSISWQLSWQLGKLLGHSEMLGNPFGTIQAIGSGGGAGLRGVGLGLVVDGSDQVRSRPFSHLPWPSLTFADLR